MTYNGIYIEPDQHGVWSTIGNTLYLFGKQMVFKFLTSLVLLALSFYDFQLSKVESEDGFKKCHGLGMLPMDLASPKTVKLMTDLAKGITKSSAKFPFSHF
jgi:hypothetical protein